MSIPRIGEEVIVEFLDGNPDRPIVTGRVYNAQRMPPESLSAAQAKTVFRTRSTKDADATAFHELTFDDTKGSESIFFQSERDFTRIVENNDILKVGFEKTTPGDRTIEVYNNQKVTVGLGSGTGTYTLEAAKSFLLRCGSSTIELTPEGINLTASSITLKADGALSAQAASITAKSDGAMTLNAGADATVQGGANVVIKGPLVKIN
jgi:type VI secretion system secreted protein VgrG